MIELLKVDEAGGMAYFIASPDKASERYLYRINLDGTDMQRVTPKGPAATHSYKICSDARYAIHQVSRFDDPPVWDLVTLPEHKPVRILESNEALKKTIQGLARMPMEFFRVEIPAGDSGNEQPETPLELEAWCMLPPDFDKTKSYPLLIYVYGEPAGTAVCQPWGPDPTSARAQRVVWILDVGNMQGIYIGIGGHAVLRTTLSGSETCWHLGRGILRVAFHPDLYSTAVALNNQRTLHGLNVVSRRDHRSTSRNNWKATFC